MMSEKNFIHDSKWIGAGIKSIINTFEHEFYIVQQDFEKKCACVDYLSGDPDATCKKCFGLGYKIGIRKIKGVNQDTRISFKNTAASEHTLSNTYFINQKYKPLKDNIIVDNGEPLHIYSVMDFFEARRDEVYYRCFINPLKKNSKEFMEHFNRFLKGVL